MILNIRVYREYATAVVMAAAVIDVRRSGAVLPLFDPFFFFAFPLLPFGRLFATGFALLYITAVSRRCAVTIRSIT